MPLIDVGLCGSGKGDTDQLQAYQMYIAANPLKAKLKTREYILSQAQYSA